MQHLTGFFEWLEKYLNAIVLSNRYSQLSQASSFFIELHWPVTGTTILFENIKYPHSSDSQRIRTSELAVFTLAIGAHPSFQVGAAGFTFTVVELRPTHSHRTFQVVGAETATDSGFGAVEDRTEEDVRCIKIFLADGLYVGFAVEIPGIQAGGEGGKEEEEDGGEKHDSRHKTLASPLL